MRGKLRIDSPARKTPFAKAENLDQNLEKDKGVKKLLSGKRIKELSDTPGNAHPVKNSAPWNRFLCIQSHCFTNTERDLTDPPNRPEAARNRAMTPILMLSLGAADARQKNRGQRRSPVHNVLKPFVIKIRMPSATARPLRLQASAQHGSHVGDREHIVLVAAAGIKTNFRDPPAGQAVKIPRHLFSIALHRQKAG